MTARQKVEFLSPLRIRNLLKETPPMDTKEPFPSAADARATVERTAADVPVWAAAKMGPIAESIQEAAFLGLYRTRIILETADERVVTYIIHLLQEMGYRITAEVPRGALHVFTIRWDTVPNKDPHE